MRLLLVKDGEREVWVAALAHEHLYSYVANTGFFHDNNALRNDYYMEFDFEYEEIDIVRAKELIAAGVGLLDEDSRADALAKWRADSRGLTPADVFAAVAGTRP
ncbi:hypothetical protein [Kribbella sp. CA-293567]|uniref:hypothetical protein n=1 Tax=Kribbella sp. CA-293567 TaxID=3002436 RepID=UPI0022DD1BBC|nr:hypothetical protein [Kribbella sp. CA-293567]WBQ07135.1 hypothetical protein OX958_10115 [Kribbella sp. CA-293567]